MDGSIIFIAERNMRHGIIILGIVLWWTTGTALAHKVNIFAWVEGDTVYTESKFNGGKKVINSPVEVYGTDGTKLLEGKTNEFGEFSFPTLQKAGMKVVLLAGMGHKSEWTISASELLGNDPEPEHPEEAKKTVPEKTESASASPCLNTDEIRNVVEKAMDKKLQPVIHDLRKSMNPDQEPNFRDILAGLGYIMGLIGVAAYVHSRKKKD
jgi:nickel transport protein